MISGYEWGLRFPDICLTVGEKPQPGKLTRPGMEPGAATWEATTLLLHHNCGLFECFISRRWSVSWSDHSPFKSDHCPCLFTYDPIRIFLLLLTLTCKAHKLGRSHTERERGKREGIEREREREWASEREGGREGGREKGREEKNRKKREKEKREKNREMKERERERERERWREREKNLGKCLENRHCYYCIGT